MRLDFYAAATLLIAAPSMAQEPHPHKEPSLLFLEGRKIFQNREITGFLSREGPASEDFLMANIESSKIMTPEQFADLNKNKEIIQITDMHALKGADFERFLHSNPQLKKGFEQEGDQDESGTSDTTKYFVIEDGSITGLYTTMETKDGLEGFYLNVPNGKMDNLLPAMLKISAENNGQVIFKNTLLDIKISTTGPQTPPTP